jgi:hypothetical protein
MATATSGQAGPSRLPLAFDPDSPLFVAQATVVSGKLNCALVDKAEE